MARDKLITIRIEGDKRQAFGDLAKSQNTDTASLLYDFISGCLDGRIDIKLVTGKGNRLDNQIDKIDSDRIDKLEATTQRLDNWIGALSERLNDWILRSEQGLSEKITSLEHRLNTLSIQLDSQRLDRIDTDSQKDRQGENPDIEPVATVEIADNVETVIETVETVTEIDESVDEPDTSPLPNQETVETANTVESDSSIEPVTGEGVTIDQQGLTNAQLSEKTRVPVSTIEKWKKKIKEGKEVTPRDYPDFFKQWRLNPSDNLWYEVD